MFKRFFCCVLTVAVVLSIIVVPSAAATSYTLGTIRINYTKLIVNGQESGANTLLYNDNMYIQVGVAAKELGFTHSWNAKTNTTSIFMNSSSKPAITTGVKSPEQTITNARIYLNYTILIINGIESSARTLLYNDYLYMQIGAAAKELGFSHSWDAATNTTNINNEGQNSTQLLTPLISAPIKYIYYQPWSALCFKQNSFDSVEIYWCAKNNSGKTIYYYTCYISMYNPVGDPAYDEITGKSTIVIKTVGPIAPGEMLILAGDTGVYSAVCHKVVIDKIVLEYADRTIETFPYYYGGYNETYLFP